MAEPLTPSIPLEVGPLYDCGIINSSGEKMGFVIKPGTYRKDVQTVLRDQVVGAVSQSLVDRDVEFWKRISQQDWSGGTGQNLFEDDTMYRGAKQVVSNQQGAIQQAPQWSSLGNASEAYRATNGMTALRGNVFGPWTAARYAWYNINGGTLTTTNTVPAGVQYDMCSDGTNVFAVGSWAGVYTTTGVSPGNMTQYDTGSTGPYYTVTYDPLNKRLYGTKAYATGPVLDLINSGGAPTQKYDFVTGRIDAACMHDGHLILAWASDGSPFSVNTGSYGETVQLMKWDGTNMTLYADLPSGSWVKSMRSVFGVLIINVYTADAFQLNKAPDAIVYTITGDSLNRVGSLNNSAFGSFAIERAIAESNLQVFIGSTGWVFNYDLVFGGLSQPLGQIQVPNLAQTVSQQLNGLATYNGVLYGVGYGSDDKVYFFQYNSSGAAGLIPPTSTTVFANQLIGSRMDANLPYVNKFWYGIDCIFDPLESGESVAMDYSFDDGQTYTTCSNSPYSTAAGTKTTFLVQDSNPHITYRIRLAQASGTAGPTVHAIAPRYTVPSANGSVYTMTVMCYDQIRYRNSDLSQPGYGYQAINFLNAIARGDAQVTFYEPDDPDRTAHTCWVMDASLQKTNTGETYNPLLNEGDMVLTLWETVAS